MNSKKDPVPKPLSKDSILQALRALSEEIPLSEPPPEILLMGGAAIVLLYGARESTRDVDAILPNPSFREAAKRVAGRLGLPPDWLNDGAKGYAHGRAPGDIVFQAPSLIVRSLAPQQLLAMKLCAWRDDLDISDARLLLSKIPGGRKAAWDAVRPFLVPGRELKSRYAFEELWGSLHGNP